MAKLVTIHRSNSKNAVVSTPGKPKSLPHADTIPLGGLKLPHAMAIAGARLACLGAAVIHWGRVGAQNELSPSQARNQTQLKLSRLPSLRSPH